MWFGCCVVRALPLLPWPPGADGMHAAEGYASVEMADSHGLTPLHYAAKGGHSPVIDLLLNVADTSKQATKQREVLLSAQEPGRGYTPLVTAIRGRQLEAVGHLLLCACAVKPAVVPGVNLGDHRGWTAMHEGVRLCALGTVRAGLLTWANNSRISRLRARGLGSHRRGRQCERSRSGVCSLLCARARGRRTRCRTAGRRLCTPLFAATPVLWCADGQPHPL
jgi:hypothetical protein